MKDITYDVIENDEMLPEKAYLLYRGDGTSLGATPDVKGVALSQKDAEDWVALEPEGSWNYRKYYETPIITGIMVPKGLKIDTFTRSIYNTLENLHNDLQNLQSLSTQGVDSMEIYDGIEAIIHQVENVREVFFEEKNNEL